MQIQLSNNWKQGYTVQPTIDFQYYPSVLVGGGHKGKERVAYFDSRKQSFINVL